VGRAVEKAEVGVAVQLRVRHRPQPALGSRRRLVDRALP
jgi:hypothetical protein